MTLRLAATLALAASFAVAIIIAVRLCFHWFAEDRQLMAQGRCVLCRKRLAEGQTRTCADCYEGLQS